MPPVGSVKKDAKRPSKSKSAKAGLMFPVARVNRRLIESKTTKRIGAAAPVYLAAVLEYYAAEILELTIKDVRANLSGRSRITPTDVLRAIRNDAVLNAAANGLVVMVGDKAKDTAELITSKTDRDKKGANAAAAAAAAAAEQEEGEAEA